MASSDEESDSTKIKLLVRKRGTRKGRLTHFVNYLEQFGKTALSVSQQAEVKLRMQGALSLFTEFNDIQDQIETLVPDSEMPKQLETREIFETSYYSALAKAQCMCNDLEGANSSKTQSTVPSVQLPTITLPTFSGSYEHWLEFRDTFKSLVHNNDKVDSFGKMHYLKRSLAGDAKQVIDAIEVSAANYIIAWELLLSRYDNSRLLVHTHVKSLFSLQTLTKESPDLIRKFVDTIVKNLRSLNILGEATESWDTLIIYMAVTKLDPATEREWEQHKSSLISAQSDGSKVVIKLTDLLKFLRDRADMLETLNLNHTKHTNNAREPKKQNFVQNTAKVHCNIVTDKPAQGTSTYSKRAQAKRLCLACNGNHPLYSCQMFLDYSVQDRLKLVRDNKLCENCFRVGHTSSGCRNGPCRKCERKHNSLIHTDDGANESQANHRAVALLATDKEPSAMIPVSSVTTTSNKDTRASIETFQAADNAHNNDVVQCAHSTSVQPVLLSTAIVELPDNLGIYHQARAILDSGSERSFITKSLCDKLNAKLIQSTQSIQGVGGFVTQSAQTCNIEIKSVAGTFIRRMECFVLPQITSQLPTVAMSRSDFNIPDHIQLADPSFCECMPIDLLLGVDVFWDLMAEGRMRLANGPYLQNTMLGWVLAGTIFSHNKGQNKHQCYFSQSLDTMESIDNQLRKFWEIEEMPSDNKFSECFSTEEQTCEDNFVKTTERLPSGRFCVQIPMKHSPDLLGQSYTQAERRFLALEKRLQRDESYKRMYGDFIHEYLSLGHMSLVTAHGTPHYFMPHHGVYRAQATTTKLRVVFDCSSPSSSGKSLNDLQLVGPPIQGDLVAILLRFRENRYVACADVEKMYRQVTINENQRDLQLILWRDAPTLPLQIYKLNTVTYGTASAPFLACRCLKQLALECSDADVARIIQEDFYVDDLISGHSNATKLWEICRDTAEVLNSACFPLRKWIFNFDCASPDGAESDTSTKELSLGENTHSKTLGIGWYNKNDELFFHSKLVGTVENDSNTPMSQQTITKRLILSGASQIFDPLGLLSPLITKAKVLLQKLWLLKLGWDEAVPRDIAQVWDSFVNDLFILKNIRVPRHVMCDDPTRIELHIFTDASQIAYGSCAYFRTVDNGSRVTVRLLFSKGKVASIRPISIPRCELLGALVGARLFAKIIKSIRSRLDKVVFWTDSMIVLGWLRMPPNLLKTFVQNRVAEIHELTSGNPWHHVKGIHNPADLISRGLGLEALQNSDLWWNGPQFLHDPNFNGERIESIVEHDGTLPEVRSGMVQSLVAQEAECTRILFPFSRFSQFDRMRRACAYVLRFIHNTRFTHDRRTDALSVEELRESSLTLARLSQLESFPSIFDNLRKDKPIKSTQHAVSNLNLFLDKHNDHELLRVGGRISNSEFNYAKKHPILLCGRHHFTMLLMRHEHKQLMHAGPQMLLFTLREEWWPIGGRNLARAIVHRCVTCARLRGRTLNPLMGNLPKERLDYGVPFLKCGVDYAGPVSILNRKGRGARTVKAYICLFVCFVTRAIHLEVVSDLTSDAYLLALKRFISRRGKPAEIYSDNGTNFVGLMNDFAKVLAGCSAEIKEYATSQNIVFRMIPAHASHFGGLWEAGVKSCKHHMRRVIGNANLTFEELSTVLTQVEAILNSRPLTPMSSDPQDLSPLTPAHFLVGRPLTAPVPVELHDVPVHRLSRYQRIEQIRQHFWARWSKEVVSELQQRSKWKENRDDLAKDTMVLIKDDNLPPLKWSLGRITRTFPGKDGISRVAEIKTASNTIRRAFSKICPLPVRDEV